MHQKHFSCNLITFRILWKDGKLILNTRMFDRDGVEHWRWSGNVWWLLEQCQWADQQQSCPQCRCKPLDQHYHQNTRESVRRLIAAGCQHSTDRHHSTLQWHSHSTDSTTGDVYTISICASGHIYTTTVLDQILSHFFSVSTGGFRDRGRVGHAQFATYPKC